MLIATQWTVITDEIPDMQRIAREDHERHIAYLMSEHHRREVERIGKLWERALNLRLNHDA